MRVTLGPSSRPFAILFPAALLLLSAGDAPAPAPAPPPPPVPAPAPKGVLAAFPDGLVDPGHVVRTLLWLVLAAWIARELWRAVRPSPPPLKTCRTLTRVTAGGRAQFSPARPERSAAKPARSRGAPKRRHTG